MKQILLVAAIYSLVIHQSRKNAQAVTIKPSDKSTFTEKNSAQAAELQSQLLMAYSFGFGNEDLDQWVSFANRKEEE